MNKLLAAVVLNTTLAASLSAGSAFAAGAMRVDAPHYTCDRGGLSHVVLVQPPAPCCKGSFGCPQLLSNTGLVKPKASNRT